MCQKQNIIDRTYCSANVRGFDGNTAANVVVNPGIDLFIMDKLVGNFLS